jgi:hypothetical protein
MALLLTSVLGHGLTAVLSSEASLWSSNRQRICISSPGSYAPNFIMLSPPEADLKELLLLSNSTTVVVFVTVLLFFTARTCNNNGIRTPYEIIEYCVKYLPTRSD